VHLHVNATQLVCQQSTDQFVCAYRLIEAALSVPVSSNDTGTDTSGVLSYAYSQLMELRYWLRVHKLTLHTLLQTRTSFLDSQQKWNVEISSDTVRGLDTRMTVRAHTALHVSYDLAAVDPAPIQVHSGEWGVVPCVQVDEHVSVIICTCAYI
jgi:hypothetical protein